MNTQQIQEPCPCNRCEALMQLSTKALHETTVLMNDGTQLQMTYITCDNCHVSYKVSFFSKETQAILDTLRDMEQQYLRCVKQHERTSVMNRMNKQYKKMRNQYTKVHQELQEKYAGQTYQQVEDKQLDMYVPEHNPEKEN